MSEYRVVWVGDLQLYRGDRPYEARDVPQLTDLLNEMNQEGWLLHSMAESSGGVPKGLFVIFEGKKP